MARLAEGKQYQVTVKGEKIIYTLYPISYLCAELTKALKTPRTPTTIRKWERDKIIPSAPFTVRNVRMYHEDYVNTLVRIAKEEKIKQGASFLSSAFRERAWTELTEINRKLRGKTDGQ